MDNAENSASKYWPDCAKRRFNLLLEERDILIQKFQIDDLFQSIDTDGNGSITKSELQAFVNIQKEKAGTIFKSTVLNAISWAAHFISCVFCFPDSPLAAVLQQVRRRCRSDFIV